MTSTSKTKTLDQILQKAGPFFQTKFNNKKIGTYLVSYLESEEFTELEIIAEDLSTKYNDCQLVEAIALKFKFSKNKAKQKKLWHVLRVLFQLEKEQSIKSSKSMITRSNTSVVSPEDIIWQRAKSITAEEEQKNRNYINEQCGGVPVLRAHKNKSLLQIIALGKINSLNLLPLLYDVYSKYRIGKAMSQRDENTGKFIGPSIQPTEFVQSSRFLKDLQLPAIELSLIEFESRMNPRFNMNRMTVIDDNCEAFIDYALLVSSAISNLISTHACLPLQVDLVIIPKNVRSNIINDAFQDYEEEDDDVDEFSDQYNEQKRDTNQEFSISTSFEKLIKTYVPSADKYCLQVDEYGNIAPVSTENPVRELSDLLEKIVMNNKDGNGMTHKRIEIVIDRRTSPNEIFVYTLPDDFGRIKHDYCIEGLIFASANNIVPHTKQTMIDAGSPYMGGKYDSDGRMFVLSFAILEFDLLRLQWFFNGGGMRFWPHLMRDLWPSCFAKQKLGKKYSLQYIEDGFRLNYKDPQFDIWYKTLLGK